MEVTLRTPRLLLRPPRAEDFEAWAALDDDKVAMRFIGGRCGRARSWEGLAIAVGMWRLRDCGLFSVLEAESGRWIGRVGPWLPEGAVGTEVGWALDRSAWGRGYATEAARAAVAWAIDVLGWASVIHQIRDGNRASIAVAERLGARRLRTRLERGKLILVYGQSREDWNARPA
jgi:RimJ/RimL family protein N-acetyltransferase